MNDELLPETIGATNETADGREEVADEDCGFDIRGMRLNIFQITNGACRSLPGPCIHEICRFNLISEEKGRGGNRSSEPVVRDLSEPCVLALAERGGMTLEEVASTLGLTRERVRQIELYSLKKLCVRLTVDED